MSPGPFVPGVGLDGSSAGRRAASGAAPAGETYRVPAISRTRLKKARLRSDEMPQLAGMLW